MTNINVEIPQNLIVDIMGFVRVKTDKAQREIEDSVQACLMDLERNGIYIQTIDATIKQALKLYCKGNYGYDENSEKFMRAYESLRDALALSSDYERVIQNG